MRKTFPTLEDFKRTVPKTGIRSLEGPKRKKGKKVSGHSMIAAGRALAPKVYQSIKD